jgi:PhnB protein
VRVNTYLSFKGDCEAAFRLYERCLGGHIEAVFRYGGSPLASQAPPGWGDKVMHASITIGEQVLMGADVAPDRYETPKGMSLSIHTGSIEEAERVFRELGEGGRVVMPLEETFWAPRFGMVVDRFGVPWLVSAESEAVS